MLVILTGPTGSGKTSVALQLKQRYGWHLIETLTTRPARERNFDTKAVIDTGRVSSILLAPSEYRIFEYESHIYATPIRPVQLAARTPMPVFVVDWVHPHPEDLSYLGPHIVAAVLLPSSAELKDRLERATRGNRISRALEEHAHITERLNDYTPPWTVVESNTGVAELAELIRSLVDAAVRKSRRPPNGAD